jgi:DNA-binding transcriptional MocR family regulator
MLQTMSRPTTAPASRTKALISQIEQRLSEPTARGLSQAVGAAIRDGALTPGTKLPPIRTVAAELTLSPTTVSAGWALLARSGSVRTDGRRGTTVLDPTVPDASRYRAALERQAEMRLDLSTGVPDARLLPSLRVALEHLTTAGTPGSYLDDPVLPELMQVLLAEWPFATTELTVVDGAMDGLDLVARTALRFGDRVVVENPTFPPLVDLLESVGVAIAPVRMDSGGLSVDGLRQALSGPVAAVFLQPRAHNPTGVTMTLARAEELAAALADTKALVVEDDSAGSISVVAPLSLGRWLPDRTVHVRSFSKSHGPDLRLAAMSGPAEVMAAVESRRHVGQGWSSRLLQRILLSLLTDPVAVAAVARARDEYARRRATLLGALARHGVVTAGTDGLNIWVPVHDEAAAMVRLARRGIGVAPGKAFIVQPGEGDHVRVTTGLVEVGDAEHVAETLAAASRTTAWRPRAR